MTATDQSGRVDHVDASTLGEPPRLRMPGALVRALRPKQWLKNVLVFAAPVAAGVIRARVIGRSCEPSGVLP